MFNGENLSSVDGLNLNKIEMEERVKNTTHAGGARADGKLVFVSKIFGSISVPIPFQIKFLRTLNGNNIQGWVNLTK